MMTEGCLPFTFHLSVRLRDMWEALPRISDTTDSWKRSLQNKGDLIRSLGSCLISHSLSTKKRQASLASAKAAAALYSLLK